MSSSLIIEVSQAGVAKLILNRPELANAFDDELIGALNSALTELGQNPKVRLLQIEGRGKHFSAGADLNWMRRTKALDYQENFNDAGELAQLLKKLDEFPAPTLALVQGAAYGGASGIISCCDMTIATTDATFCFSEVKLGLIPAVISPYVVRSIGPRQARRWFLSAEKIPAQRAQSLGLVHMLCEPEQLHEQAENWCAGVLKNGPDALKACKTLIHTVAGAPIDSELMAYTQKQIADLRVSSEGQEGLNAFFAKRRPAWIQE